MDYKSHITGIFDRNASEYSGFGTHFFDIFAEKLVDLSECSKGACVLDVATGRGAILKRILPRIGEEGKIVGIDISSKMIEALKTEVRNKNAHLECLDVEMLDLAASSFDFIYCGFGLFFFPDLERVLRAFYRLLKPQGKIAVSIWGEMGKTRLALRERLISHGVYSNPFAYPISSFEQLEMLIAQAGFTGVKIVSEKYDHVYANFDHWLNSLWRHAARDALEKLNEDQLQSLKDELCSELDEENRCDGFHEELNVIYAIATKIV